MSLLPLRRNHESGIRSSLDKGGTRYKQGIFALFRSHEMDTIGTSQFSYENMYAVSVKMCMSGVGGKRRQLATHGKVTGAISN